MRNMDRPTAICRGLYCADHLLHSVEINPGQRGLAEDQLPQNCSCRVYLGIGGYTKSRVAVEPFADAYRPSLAVPVIDAGAPPA